MPTTKPSRRKPQTHGQPSRGFPRPRRTTQTARPRTRFPRTRAKPAANEPSGLIGRAQATLRGRKPPAKNTAVSGVVSSLGSAKSSALARKPSKKSIVGILAGGVGVAAMAKRRRNGNQSDMPTTPPLQPVQASGEDRDSMAD
jgi:hypothetical protein